MPHSIYNCIIQFVRMQAIKKPVRLPPVFPHVPRFAAVRTLGTQAFFSFRQKKAWQRICLRQIFVRSSAHMRFRYTLATVVARPLNNTHVFKPNVYRNYFIYINKKKPGNASAFGRSSCVPQRIRASGTHLLDRTFLEASASAIRDRCSARSSLRCGTC